MPVNAPIEYFKAEEKFRSAKTREEKIKALEEMIRLLPKHKGSENLLRDLRKRLAKLRAQKEVKVTAKPKFIIKKEGAAQVCLVGFTNSGKSTILKSLTNAKVEIASHPFTTTEPKVGMMNYEDVQIQLVEIPSTFDKDVMNIVRNCDGIVFLIDGTKDEKKQMEKLLEMMRKNKIKINEKPKKIKIEKRSNGIEIRGKNFLKGSIEEVREILQVSGYRNCLLVLQEEVSIDDIMDSLDRSLVYKNAIFIVTKVKELEPEKIKEKIWKLVKLVRVYVKPINKSKPEERPVTLPLNSTVKNLIKKLHREDLLKNFRFAKVWGKSVKHNFAKVGLDHVLADKDIVEIHS